MIEHPSREVWQKLLPLESQDIVQDRFKRIHSRELNVRRAREINAATKQAREFFMNAYRSDYSVRPLLTYYGVASLGRALVLLLKARGGEESIKSAHGIATVDWRCVISGDVSAGMTRLGELKIRKRLGLFSDFAQLTKNRICLHVRSGGVDGSIDYGVPDGNEEISIADLFSRIPDLREDYLKVSDKVRYAAVNEMTYSQEKGFRAKVQAESFCSFKSAYEHYGYAIALEGDWCIVTCDSTQFIDQPPMFIHSYLHKMFGSIPVLYIAEPLPSGTRYSQLCVTYMVAYVLGMLVRYYPTLWIALTQGGKGDVLWPTVNRAQQLVEITYPELVAEFIEYVVGNSQ